MSILFNENKEIVKAVKEGLKKRGGYCRAEQKKQKITNAYAVSLENRLQILNSRGFAIACSTIRKKTNIQAIKACTHKCLKT